MRDMHGGLNATHKCTSFAREAFSKVWAAAKMTDMSVTNYGTVRQCAQD